MKQPNPRNIFYKLLVSVFTLIALVVIVIWLVNSAALPKMDEDISSIELKGNEAWFVLQYEDEYKYIFELWRPDGTKALTAEEITAVYPGNSTTFIRATNRNDGSYSTIDTTWYKVVGNDIQEIDLPIDFDSVVQYSPNDQYLLVSQLNSKEFGMSESKVAIQDVATGVWKDFSYNMLPAPYNTILEDGSPNRIDIGWYKNQVVFMFYNEDIESPKTIAQFAYDPATEVITEISDVESKDFAYYSPKQVAYPLFRDGGLPEFQPRYTLAMPLIGMHGVIDREATVNTKSMLAPTFQIGRGLFHGGIYLGENTFVLRYKNSMTLYNATTDRHIRFTELQVQDGHVFANMYPIELAK